MSPFTSTSMMSRRVSCDCGRSSRGAIGNDGAGWAEKAGPYTINATDGNMDAWQNLYDQATAGLSTDAAYFRVQGRNADGSRNPAIPIRSTKSKT